MHEEIKRNDPGISFPAMLSILAVLLLGLPFLGVFIWGQRPLSVYMDFPPKPGLIEHAPFSPAVFAGLSAFIAACLAPFVFRAARVFLNRQKTSREKECFPFPFWGWIGVLVCALAWFFAWTRFEWFSGFQLYTFPFLWVGYIIIVNALCFKRTGKCLLSGKTPFFLALFPASAVFWWFFEYLNRFVLNWYYVNVDMFTPPQYIAYASACFSTVLPAVLSTAELLGSLRFFREAYRDFIVIKPRNPGQAAVLVLAAASLGLFLLGLFPNYLFPLLWISPFLIIICVHTLAGQEHILSPAGRGNWSRIVSFAASALVCGFFWEMWNFYSFARWEYSIPFVHALQVFEMPLPGYAGYLPFGLECAAVGDMLERLFSRGSRSL